MQQGGKGPTKDVVKEIVQYHVGLEVCVQGGVLLQEDLVDERCEDELEQSGSR
jgi:hypothetical protein